VDHDLYAILGVPPAASEDQIRHAFWTLAKKYHPDVCRDDPDAARKFIEVGTAAETLLDPARRASYDKSRPRTATPPPRPPGQPPRPASPPSAASPPPRPAPPVSPLLTPKSGFDRLDVRVTVIVFAVLIAIAVVGTIVSPQQPQPQPRNDTGGTPNGAVLWTTANYRLDDGWGFNLAGHGPLIQIVPGTATDLMNTGGYLSSDGQIAVLIGDGVTYQQCVSAVGQSSMQSIDLSDIAPGDATVCVHGGGGDLASIHVITNKQTGITFNITIWEYI
jgi:hypothetical protein